MSRYPDECHLIVAIGLVFVGLFAVGMGITQMPTAPDYSDCEDHIISEEYCRASAVSSYTRDRENARQNILIGVGITAVMLAYGGCMVKSIREKHQKRDQQRTRNTQYAAQYTAAAPPQPTYQFQFTQSTTRCSKCGHESKINEKFCSKCGFLLSP